MRKHDLQRLCDEQKRLMTEKDREIRRLVSLNSRPISEVQIPRELCVAAYAVALLFDNRAEAIAVRSGDSFGELLKEYTGYCERAHDLKSAARGGTWYDLEEQAMKLANELFE